MQQRPHACCLHRSCGCESCHTGGAGGRGGGAVLTQGGADIVDGARRVRLGDEGVAAGGLALAEAG